MRLILEKTEIVTILGHHFDAELDPEKVVIRTDPFEIEVCGLPLGSSAPPREETNVVALRRVPGTTATRPPPREGPEARDDDEATTVPPMPGVDGISPESQDVHPAAVMAASKALEAELEKNNPRLARRSGRYSHTPPTDSEGEV